MDQWPQYSDLHEYIILHKKLQFVKPLEALQNSNKVPRGFTKPHQNPESP